MTQRVAGVLVLGAVIAGWWVSTSVASAGPAPPGSPFSLFEGDWVHAQHDGLLTVSPNGHGIDHFRTFVPCDQRTHFTDCDKTIGNTIYPGGFFTFILRKPKRNVADGEITNAGYSWEVGTRVRLRLGTNYVLSVTDASGTIRTCGIRALNLHLGGCS